MPANNAATVARRGSVPATIIDDATAAPRGKLPSGVISAKRSTRDAMYTPHARAAKPSPCVIATSQNSNGLLPFLTAVVAEIVDADCFDAQLLITESASAITALGIVTPYARAASRSTISCRLCTN